MACDLKPTCDFIFGFLKCTLPQDIIDVELTVRKVKEIHTFRKDHTTESATWSREMKPFPCLRKKVEAFGEEKKDENSPFHPNPIKFTMKDAPTKRSRERSHRRSKQRKLDMGHFVTSMAKRPAFLWAPLPASKTTTTTTMARNTQIATTTPPVLPICKNCEKWGTPCPFCIPPAPFPSPQQSDWSKEDLNSDRQRARGEK